MLPLRRLGLRFPGLLLAAMFPVRQAVLRRAAYLRIRLTARQQELKLLLFLIDSSFYNHTEI